jgi:hypothetical protein
METYILAEKEDIDAIADAIRAKTGIEGQMSEDEMIEALESIKVDYTKELIEGTLTEYFNDDIIEIVDYAFYNCNSLTSVNFPNVTTIGNSAFSSCYSLTSVDFPNVTDLEDYAFYSCDSLTSVNFPNVTGISFQAFYSCGSLTSVDFPNATRIDNYVFYNCKSLTSINFPNVTGIGNYVFTGCDSLTSVDFPNVTRIENRAFSNCASLICLILRARQIVTTIASSAGGMFTGCYHFTGTVHDTYNPEGLKDGYIYVPKSLVEDYKSANLWKDYESQIRAIEDYTIDGTITGELDLNKL